jgi:hypothetical protein
MREDDEFCGEPRCRERGEHPERAYRRGFQQGAQAVVAALKGNKLHRARADARREHQRLDRRKSCAVSIARGFQGQDDADDQGAAAAEGCCCSSFKRTSIQRRRSVLKNTRGRALCLALFFQSLTPIGQEFKRG